MLEGPKMEELTSGTSEGGPGSYNPVVHIGNSVWNRAADTSATDYELGARLAKLPAKSILFTFLLPTKCQESFQVRAITVKENRT